MMASSYCQCPDIWSWIHNLPPISQWGTNTVSMCVCSSASPQPSFNFSIAKNLNSSSVSFAIVADFNLSVSLWTSKPLKVNPKSSNFIGQEAGSKLLKNFIKDILDYGQNNNRPFLVMPKLDSVADFKDIFNLAFFTLAAVVCVYEAPVDLRSTCLDAIQNQLASPNLREASKLLMKLLGSNIEEQWMRSVGLAMTNWITELQERGSRHLRAPSPLFSHAFPTTGLWKVQLYCPVIAMDFVNTSNPSNDERLNFSLNYHQLEGVIQFNNKVVIRDRWIDVMVNIDNIRLDVVRLVSGTLMDERGAGSTEKHFPSRISLQLTPTLQTDVISVSVSKSSENPAREIGKEKGIEASFDPPTSVGLTVSAGESSTVSLKPWKFEESVLGYSANLNWYLHDSADGKEVITHKPSMMSLLLSKTRFKDRYSSAYRPFTRQGGIVFAGDEYGESVLWKVDRNAAGKTLEWEIRGWIWVTYWPNKHRTLHHENRRLEFRDILKLTLS